MNVLLQRARAWISRRLERRVAAYFIIAILSISLIFGALSLAATFWIVRQHQRGDLENRLDRIVARLDDKANLFVRHTQDLSKSSLVMTALLDSKGRNIYLAPFFAHYRFPLTEPHGLALCDFEGQLLAQQKWHPVGCLAELPQSRAVLDTERPQTLIVAIEQKPHLVLFQPVFYPGTGRVEGYILATLDLQAAITEATLAGPNATLLLHSPGGTADFAARAGALVSPEPLEEPPTRHLFSGGPFASAGLTLAFYEHSTLFAGLEYLLLGYGLGTLTLLALALVLSHQLARRVAEPLLILNRTARQIAVKGPTAALANVDRTDEIGELAGSFNAMVAALRQAQAGLEVHIQTRTKELQQALIKVEQTEKQTRTYSEYQRAVLDNFPFLVWLKDQNSRFLAVNAPFARAAGFDSSEALVGLSDLDIWPADLAETYRADDQVVLAGGKPKHVEELIEQTGQPRRWFETYKSPVILEGQVIGMVGFSRNVTECREAQHLLTVQRDLLLALEQVNDPVMAMQAILDAALCFTGVDSGGIYEVDPKDGSLTLRVHHGLSAAYIAAVRTRAGDSPSAEVVRAGQPSYSFSNPLPDSPDYIKAEGLRACAAIPILHDGQAVACFNMASHCVERIPPTTCQALEALALQLGGALTRLRTQAELEEQRVNLSTVFDNLEDFLFILDEHGNILRINPVVERRLGYSRQDLLGRHVLDLHPPDRREEAGRIVAAMLAGQTDFCPVPLLTRNGRQIWVETRVVLGQWSGLPALIGLSRDITERKIAEDALRESESRFHTLVDLLPYGVSENDLTGRITFANPALERLHDYPEGSSIGRFIWDCMADPAEREALRDYLQLLVREQPSPTPYFMRNRRSDDGIVEVQVDWAYRRDEQGQLQGFAAVVTDITERKRLLEALREQAIRDPLTGLFNRRYLDETLPRELSRCQRHGEPLVIAMLDLDHFKRLNDVYGHEAGDTVLRSVGDLLSRSLRASDLPCRYGGEELTIILHGATLEDARLRLDSLRRAFMQLRLCYQDSELPMITVSIGVAAARKRESDAAALLARADAALYQAKAQGRNRVVVDGDSDWLKAGPLAKTKGGAI